MIAINTAPPPGITSFIDSIKDIEGSSEPPSDAHVYRTTAFTGSLSTGDGGWIDVAVKTRNSREAFTAIGEFLHGQYPELYTSPRDWMQGTVQANYELQKDFGEIVGMDPHDMPAYVVMPLTPFQWRQDHRDDVQREGFAKGEVPPFPANLPEHPGFREYPMQYTGLDFMLDLGSRTYRCPRCIRIEKLPQGAEVQHDGHTLSRWGAILVVQHGEIADHATEGSPDVPLTTPTTAQPASNTEHPFVNIPANLRENLLPGEHATPIHEHYDITWETQHRTLPDGTHRVQSHNLLVDGKNVGTVYLSQPQNVYSWQLTTRKKDIPFMHWLATVSEFIFAPENRSALQKVGAQFHRSAERPMQELLDAANLAYCTWQRNLNAETLAQYQSQRAAVRDAHPDAGNADR